MPVTFHKYNLGINYVCTAAINFASDAFNLVLSAALPSATSSIYSVSNVGEISGGNGYTQGTGLPIVTPVFTPSGGISTLTGTVNPLTAAGPIGPFQYVILYDNTAGAKPLLGWWDNGTPITMANTDTFQVTWSSSQILQFQ